ncbi:MAG: AvaI/BsoBI family type II restriction endonuclease, partial [Dolichospermum sp.]
DLSPHTFFIGAAIEKRMAEEIWNDLESGKLSNAANFRNLSMLVPSLRLGMPTRRLCLQFHIQAILPDLVLLIEAEPHQLHS